MNARSTVTMTEQQRIERALDRLLTEAKRHVGPRPWPGQHEGLQSIGDATKRFLTASKAARRAAEICDDPMGAALHWAIRSLGERLHGIGGLKAMSDAMEHVAAMDPTMATWREGYLDKRWDRVGEWIA